MKLLAFSDLHRNVDIARDLLRLSAEADVLIGAGDFATNGIGATDTLDILAGSDVPVLVVHGNHDDPDEISRLCNQRDNLIYLHGSTTNVCGRMFFGLGGEIPARNEHPWNVFETEDRAAEMLSTCPEGVILISHTPPFGIADQQADGVHEGSGAIHDAIQRINPPLHLCGHIHNAWGTCGNIASTRVCNLGPTANWFSL
ncbi:MAG: metallophosphoesterase [Pseudomonadota bacterium]